MVKERCATRRRVRLCAMAACLAPCGALMSPVGSFASTSRRRLGSGVLRMSENGYNMGGPPGYYTGPERSPLLDSVIEQFLHPNQAILGVMLESHLLEGRQALVGDLTYGQSITDGCIGWDETEQRLRETYDRLG